MPRRKERHNTQKITVYIDEDIYNELDKYVYVEKKAESMTEVINNLLRKFFNKPEHENKSEKTEINKEELKALIREVLAEMK